MPDQGQYVKVKQGDCITSIADEHGFFWQTLWDDGKNSALKQLRKNPNVLAPGDEVWVPPLTLRTESRAVDAQYKFKKKGTPAVTRFCFKKDGKPQANEPYELHVNGETIKGSTDGDGMVMLEIPPDAERAVIVVGTGKEAKTYKVQLGSMDPVEIDSGVRKRLRAMGFDPGPVEKDDTGEKLKQAIRKFQAKQQVKLTGKVDDSLRQKLVEVFGC